jgi:hypothetical protein
MLLWPRLVCEGTAVPQSSLGPRLPSGCRPLAAPGALLGSLFNMKWRFSALAGGVEGSKLCLFSVIMPAKCVSSISPRFHYRRLTFCFLPLAAILESSCEIVNRSPLGGETSCWFYFILSVLCGGHFQKHSIVLIPLFIFNMLLLRTEGICHSGKSHSSHQLRHLAHSW